MKIGEKPENRLKTPSLIVTVKATGPSLLMKQETSQTLESLVLTFVTMLNKSGYEVEAVGWKWYQ